MDEKIIVIARFNDYLQAEIRNCPEFKNPVFHINRQENYLGEKT